MISPDVEHNSPLIGEREKPEALGVAACNTNQSGLQSRRMARETAKMAN